MSRRYRLTVSGTINFEDELDEGIEYALVENGDFDLAIQELAEGATDVSVRMEPVER